MKAHRPLNLKTKEKMCFFPVIIYLKHVWTLATEINYFYSFSTHSFIPASVFVPNTIWATVLYRIYNVEPQVRHFISDTIRARILYCTYEMKSTLLYASRREFTHFSMRHNRGANIVLCLLNEKHTYICPPKGISSGWTDHVILNSFASDCQHGWITFSKAEKCRRRSSLVARDYSPKYMKLYKMELKDSGSGKVRNQVETEHWSEI